MRLALAVLGLLCLLASACNQDFDPEDRRAATQDEYDVRTTSCGNEHGTAAARGTLTNHSDGPNGFSVTVRFFDGDNDLGNTIVDHVEPIAIGEDWSWEGSVELDGTVEGELRCDVIQVAIGRDVDH
jgi:hypothetical protein